MIKVLVKTNTARREIITEAESTPNAVFNDMGVSIAGSMVNLNGTLLSATDLNSSFSALGVTDGSSVNLNSIVKADGANR